MDIKVIIRKLYESGHNSKEIAEKLKDHGIEKTSATIRKCISRDFSHLREIHNLNKRNNTKEKVRQFYTEGYNSKEISKKLKENGVDIEPTTIRCHIFNNFKHLKNIHDINYKKRKDIKRETNRILNKELNDILSTRNVVKQNIQSYDKTEKNEYIFNEERGERPFDMPKVYYFKA